MSTAYSSKVLKVPVEYLAELCMLPSIAETAAELKHYGLTCDGADVHFQRSSFDLQAKLVSTALIFVCLKCTGRGDSKLKGWPRIFGHNYAPVLFW
jgi:hypothetical protein